MNFINKLFGKDSSFEKKNQYYPGPLTGSVAHGTFSYNCEDEDDFVLVNEIDNAKEENIVRSLVRHNEDTGSDNPHIINMNKEEIQKWVKIAEKSEGKELKDVIIFFPKIEKYI